MKQVWDNDLTCTKGKCTKNCINDDQTAYRSESTWEYTFINIWRITITITNKFPLFKWYFTIQIIEKIYWSYNWREKNEV